MGFRFLIILMIFLNNTMHAQELESYRWENRIVLIITNNEKAEKYQKQLELLASESGLEERKLVIYQVMPNQFTLGLKDLPWITSSKLYKKYRSIDNGFEVILIGLDGTVKLRQTEILSTEKLFSTIDVMPMRRAELKRQKR
jgi:hypothetical protein